MRSFLAAVLLLALVPACGERSPPSLTPSGVTIEVRGDTTFAQNTGFSRRFLELVEEQSIGVVDGAEEYMFGRIGVAARRPDGSVLVFDTQHDALRMYDASGGFVRNVSRRGDGPGEFAYVNGLRVFDDGGFITSDSRSDRLIWWDSAGTAVSERWVPLRLWGPPNAIVPGRDERIAFLTWILDTTELARGIAETREGYVRLEGPDAPIDTVLAPEIEDPTHVEPVVRAAGGGGATFRTPFAPSPVSRIYGFGGMLSTPGDAYLIDRLGEDGSVLRIEADAAPVEVQPEEREWITETTLEGMQRIDPAWRWSGPDVPHTKPFIRALRADDDGWIWALVHQPATETEHEPLRAPEGPPPAGGLPRQYLGPYVSWDEPSVWDLFDPEGRYYASLLVPEELSIMHRDHEWILAVHSGALGVQTLRLYRLALPRQ